MNARRKLNAGYLQGSVLIAGLLGWASSSWMVFVIALVITLIANFMAGDIRPFQRGR